jgi:hypothetical protein
MQSGRSVSHMKGTELALEPQFTCLHPTQRVSTKMQIPRLHSDPQSVSWGTGPRHLC